MDVGFMQNPTSCRVHVAYVVVSVLCSYILHMATSISVCGFSSHLSAFVIQIDTIVNAKHNLNAHIYGVQINVYSSWSTFVPL